MIKIALLLGIIGLLIISVLYYRGNVTVRSRVDKALNTIEDITRKEAGKNQNLAVRKARAIMTQALIDERDLSSGPCLEDSIILDWSVDIITRNSEIDNAIENQCPSYVNGETHHIVIFDNAGNLISAE